MEINKKDQEYNAWKDKKFILVKRVCKVSDDMPLDSEKYEQEGEPFEIENTTQFQNKLTELAYKNVALKNIAIQDGREVYTQKSIMQL